MTRRAVTFLVVIAAGLGTGCLSRPAGFERRAYKVDPSLDFKQKDLDDLIAHPPLGLQVEFVGIFNRMDEPYWQPSVTGFKPEDYRSFSVWDSDAAVWDPVGRGSSIGTLYAANEIFYLSELVKTLQYQPVRVRGVVRNTFADRPWIEVADFERIGEPAFSREAVSALYNGLQDTKSNASSAEQHLNRALKGRLTTSGQAAAYNGLGWIAHYKRDYATAEKYYLQALAVHADDEDAKEGLWRARNKKEPKYLSGATGTSGATSNDDRLSLVREITQLTRERDELKSKAELDKGEFSKAMLAESEARKKADADAARAAEQVKAMTAELDEARKRLQGAGGDAAKVAAVEARVRELEANILKAADQAKAVETERDDLKNKLQAASGAAAKVAELEGSLKAANDNVKAATDMAKALETERDDLKAKLAGAGGDTAKLVEAEASLKTANEKLKTAETERDDFKKKLEGAGGDAAKMAEIEAKVKTLEGERDELKKKLDEATAGGGDTEALKKQITEKDAQIKTLNDSMGEFEQKVKDRDDTIKKLREEIDKLTEELKKKG